MDHPLTICNGYIVVGIEGRKFMLDTGAPCNMSVHAKLLSLSINGTDCFFAYEPRYASPLKEATGLALDGLIGVDTIKRLGGITCDLAQGTATFGVPTRTDGHSVSFAIQDAYRLHTRVIVNGREVNGIMDTGAPKSMIVNNSLLANSHYVQNTTEPTLRGPLPVEQYSGEMVLDGVDKTVVMLLPKSTQVRSNLAQTNAEVFFSVANFAKEYFAIDMANQMIRFL